jgi:hypothetical protein
VTRFNEFTLLAGFEGTGTTGDRYGIKIAHDTIQASADGPVAQGLLTTISNGNWVHIVAVNDPTAGNSKIFINGVQSGPNGAVINVDSTDTNPKWTMGTYWNSPSWNFKGALDDVQVYDVALSSSDIGFLYSNPGTAVPEPSLALLGSLGVLTLLRRRRA